MSRSQFITFGSTPSRSLRLKSPTPSIFNSFPRPITPHHRSGCNPNFPTTRNPSSASPGSTPLPTAIGYLRKPVAHSVSPPKPNGNAQLAEEKKTHSFHGATNHLN